MSTAPSHALKNENRNHQPRINKLPSEILSKVFILCSQVWTPRGGDKDFPVQERIPAVCRRWRKVALDTPTLWTRIALTAGVPCPYVPLFLLRSGPTAPLDIALELIESYKFGATGKDLTTYVQQAREAIDLIIAHGGAFSRWQRLWIQTETYFTFLDTMDLFQFSSMPSLQFLEINSVGGLMTGSEGYPNPSYDTDPQLIPFVSHSLPPLRAAKFVHVPDRYLFGPLIRFRPTSLTRLELQFAESYPDLADIHTMLAATSSTLVTLCLDENPYAGQINSKDLNETFPSILFPRLRALSLWPARSQASILGLLLKMLKAPDLHVLRINFPFHGGYGSDYMQVLELDYMRVLELLTHPTGGGTKPHFPALTHLSYTANSTSTLDQEAQLRIILSAYPNIISLSLPWHFRSGAALTTEPWLAPGLVRLKVSTMMDKLEEIIESRNSGGIPLKTVEVEDRTPSPKLEWLGKRVETVTLYPRYGPEPTDPWRW